MLRFCSFLLSINCIWCQHNHSALLAHLHILSFTFAFCLFIPHTISFSPLTCLLIMALTDNHILWAWAILDAYCDRTLRLSLPLVTSYIQHDPRTCLPLIEPFSRIRH
ncbi:hypothetical protein L873DRAFT_272126 [Choiromyces venosus 120613-1]|uniref:Uncharacterized protein n=1 Tax=Choiromyces venosus 120613-1 TaxID=1336337 RepID=A0A3N4J0V1_9PEZI|nr:hypothetical protein L873DRAFT_272126 [Choiromyces venosus 120613-1]